MSPSSPRRLGPLPVDPHTRLAVPFDLGTCPRDRRSTSLPGDLGPGPRARGFYQLPRVTRARVQGHAVSTSSPGRLGPGSEAHGVDMRPGSSGLVPDVPWCRPTFLLTWVRVRGPEVWTSCPGRVGIGFKCPRGRPPFPGDAGSGPRPAGSSSYPGGLWPLSEGLRGRLYVPGETGPCQKARGIDQLSRVTRTHV